MALAETNVLATTPAPPASRPTSVGTSVFWALEMLANYLKERLSGTRLEVPALRLYTRLSPQARDDRLMLTVIRRIARADSNCIDIGAHRGVMLHEMVRRAPRGTHYAFEPIPAFAERLSSRYPGVHVMPIALGERSGRTTFYVVDSNPAYSGLRRRPYPGGAAHVSAIPVDLRRLDDVLPPEIPIRLMKIDVEGGELGVLEGAKRVLARDRPIVIFEHEPEASAEYHAGGSNAMYDLLHDELGFNVSLLGRWVNDEPHLSREEFCEQFTQRLSQNYIAY